MLLLKAVERNWGLIGPGVWEKRSWKINDDGWFQYTTRYRSGSPDIAEIPDVTEEGQMDAGKFRETKGYQFIADFADDKITGSYVQYMRGKKRYSDKDIIVREITVKKTNSGEETELGKILEVITVTGESLSVGEYTFI